MWDRQGKLDDRLIDVLSTVQTTDSSLLTSLSITNLLLTELRFKDELHNFLSQLCFQLQPQDESNINIFKFLGLLLSHTCAYRAFIYSSDSFPGTAKNTGQPKVRFCTVVRSRYCILIFCESLVSSLINHRQLRIRKINKL